MDYSIDYKNGYQFDIDTIGYEKYFLVIGDDIPRFRYKIQQNWWVKLEYRYYIEYQTYIYGWDENSGTTLIKKEIFDINGKNVLFEMSPRNLEDVEIWMNYIDSFCKLKNCNPLYKVKDFDEYNTYTDQNYYVCYVICWEDDVLKNPKGINMNSYELINNILK